MFLKFLQTLNIIQQKILIYLLKIITYSHFTGPSIMGIVWYIVKRTVKYVILHKGGEKVTIVTYHPVKQEVKRTLPINTVNIVNIQNKASL